MKSYFPLFLLLFVINIGRTQNSNLDYKSAVKIYNLTTYESSSTPNGENIVNKKNSLQLFHPTIAYQWKTKRNNFQEIELTNFNLNKHESTTEVIDNGSGGGQIISGNKTTTTLISMRYEYILNFNKNREKKIVPSLGFAARPYYSENSTKPSITTLLPSSDKELGFRAYVTPRLTYYISSRFFIDLNLPLCVLQANSSSELVDNPALPENARKTTTFNFDALTNVLSGRLGIGLKI
ncbi:MAG: hypothetical protein ABIV51_02995 [Saprospiraceae bacterium]